MPDVRPMRTSLSTGGRLQHSLSLPIHFSGPFVKKKNPDILGQCSWRLSAVLCRQRSLWLPAPKEFEVADAPYGGLRPFPANATWVAPSNLFGGALVLVGATETAPPGVFYHEVHEGLRPGRRPGQSSAPEGGPLARREDETHEVGSCHRKHAIEYGRTRPNAGGQAH